MTLRTTAAVGVAVVTLAARAASTPHPYVVGKDTVRRYLTVAHECAQAGLATTTGAQPR
jgi:hypothetical protein